jgi:hypothetical protein
MSAHGVNMFSCIAERFEKTFHTMAAAAIAIATRDTFVNVSIEPAAFEAASPLVPMDPHKQLRPLIGLGRGIVR